MLSTGNGGWDRVLFRGMSHSPLVTSGLCFYNPHITAWRADPEYRPPWDPAVWLSSAVVGKSSLCAWLQ